MALGSTPRIGFNPRSTGAFQNIFKNGGGFQFIKPPLKTARLPVSDKKIAVPVGVVLTFGKAGTLPSAEQLDDPPPDIVDFKVIDKRDTYAEAKRTTEDVRITNPDNPDNFVDVKRVKTIDFNKRPSTAPGGGGGTAETISGDNRATSFNPQGVLSYTEDAISTGMRTLNPGGSVQQVRYILTNNPEGSVG